MPPLRSCFIALTVVSLFISGCGKDDPPTYTNPPTNPPPPPPNPVDSLGAGWSKTGVVGGLVDVFFADERTGYAIGEEKMIKSIDGGVSWTNVTVPDFVTDLGNMFFLDANHGWITGNHSNAPVEFYEFILKTTDGGATFKKVTDPGLSLSDLQFLNNRLGYAVGYGKLLMSTDSGNTWVSKGQFSGLPFTLFFLDSTRGWVAGLNNTHFTADGGKSFSMQQSLSHQSTPFNIQFLDANTGWIPDSLGLSRTVNGGNSWELTPLSKPAIDVHFFNKDEGYVLQKSAILKTSDGGKTFTSVVKIPTSSFYEFHFTDSRHGWAVSGNGYIFRYVQP